jgi:hypothetical protein
MTKTFIIIVIIIAILLYIWYNRSSGTTSESFIAVDNSNSRSQLPTENKVNSGPPNNSYSTNNSYNKNNSHAPVIGNESCDEEVENTGDLGNSSDKELIINDSVVTYDDSTQESDDRIKKKFITRNHPKRSGYKYDNYSQGNRGGAYDQAIDFIDESNDLMQAGYSTNDKFVGNDESKGKYASYKPENRKVNKFKASEIFNSQNYLPNEKSVNPDWFDVVPDAIPVKNRHLINVSKSIGQNTIGTSLRNPSYDIRGSPPNPKFVISPWMQSTIEPDTNFKSLC